MKKNPLLVLSAFLSFAFICSSPVAAKDLYVSAWGGLNYIYDEDATSTAATSTINYDLGGVILVPINLPNLSMSHSLRADIGLAAEAFLLFVRGGCFKSCR
jgi:hypothetical protein